MNPSWSTLSWGLEVMQLIWVDCSLLFQSIFQANFRVNGSSGSLRWSGSLGHGTSTISAHEWTMLLQAKEHSSASSGDAIGAIVTSVTPFSFTWNESISTELVVNHIVYFIKMFLVCGTVQIPFSCLNIFFLNVKSSSIKIDFTYSKIFNKLFWFTFKRSNPTKNWSKSKLNCR